MRMMCSGDSALHMRLVAHKPVIAKRISEGSERAVCEVKRSVQTGNKFLVHRAHTHCLMISSLMFIGFIDSYHESIS